MTRGLALEEFILDMYPEGPFTQYNTSRKVYLGLHSDIPRHLSDVNLTTNIESLDKTRSQPGETKNGNGAKMRTEMTEKSPVEVNSGISCFESDGEIDQSQFLGTDDTTTVEPDPMEAQESNKDGKYWPTHREYEKKLLHTLQD